MRAMVVPNYGPPEVIIAQDMPVPEPGDHDLLIEVHAVAMNPIEAQIRQDGRGRTYTFPFIQGYDVSGVVRAIGAQVKGFKFGDAVYASPSRARNGANAEYVCVDARTAALKPQTLDHVHAAALPLVTETAWEALYDRAAIQPSETVLIQAGAGGVGHIAIQLAKLRGCRVITTAGSDDSMILCRQLGADVIVNYREDDVIAHVKQETAGRGCPVVFDTLGGHTFDLSLECLAINDRLISLVPTVVDRLPHRLFAKNATLHMELVSAPTFYGINVESHGQILHQAAELADAGRLRPHLYQVMELDDLAEAHRLQEAGHVNGKIVLRVK